MWVSYGPHQGEYERVVEGGLVPLSRWRLFLHRCADASDRTKLREKLF